jgi:hypothetical protein
VSSSRSLPDKSLLQPAFLAIEGLTRRVDDATNWQISFGKINDLHLCLKNPQDFHLLDQQAIEKRRQYVEEFPFVFVHNQSPELNEKMTILLCFSITF